MKIDADLINSVVEHMNMDHKDACLCITKAYSEHENAIDAAMTGFDSEGLDMQVSDEQHKTHLVRIPFDKPLTRENQIRGMLVAMTKHARTVLDN
ncbi:MAG: DUF2470 domain-containing protein [Granulosicoccus sp.]